MPVAGRIAAGTAPVVFAKLVDVPLVPVICGIWSVTVFPTREYFTVVEAVLGVVLFQVTVKLPESSLDIKPDAELVAKASSQLGAVEAEPSPVCTKTFLVVDVLPASLVAAPLAPPYIMSPTADMGLVSGDVQLSPDA